MTGQNATAAAPAQVPNGLATALIAGRIGGVRSVAGQNGRLWLTLLTMPAPDEYSSPATVELRSRSKLGDRDETWRGKVRISGYRRQYKAADPETGELRPVQTAEVRLEVIE